MHHLFLSLFSLRQIGRRPFQGGQQVDLSPAGSGRLLISLAVLALLAALAWFTMEPGRFRALTFVLLGFFAFRIALARMRVR